MSVPGLLANLSLPIFGAPLFIVSDPGLVIAQCRAGIVGCFPALNARPQSQLSSWLYGIAEELDDARSRGEAVAPYAVHLIAHPSNVRQAEDVAVCARFSVPLVITSLGMPTDIVAAVHSWNGLVFHEVATLRDAQAAMQAGVDGLILVCAGAAGHAGALSPFAFVDEVRAFWEGPLVLSSAVSTGRGVLAAQIMGADFASLGSRFIATEEARAAEGYKAMLRDSRAAAIVPAPLVGGASGDVLARSLDGSLNGASLVMEPDPSSPADGARPWRDSQGVGSITEVLPVALLVQRLRSEYLAARSARIRIAAAPSVAASFEEPSSRGARAS